MLSEVLRCCSLLSLGQPLLVLVCHLSLSGLLGVVLWVGGGMWGRCTVPVPLVWVYAMSLLMHITRPEHYYTRVTD